MRILSINISKPVEIEHRGRKLFTGIYKVPVNKTASVTELGIAGDGQADLENHGGEDKAIYAYSIENYRYWEQALKRPTMSFGQFGENLTVENMPDNRVHIGDIFKIGNTEMQVTQPRVPCFKLGIKMDLQRFPKTFMSSGRVGFYLRVLKKGKIDQNDHITLFKADHNQLSIEEAMLALIKGPRQQQVSTKALAIKALSKAWRDSLEKKLTNKLAG